MWGKQLSLPAEQIVALYQQAYQVYLPLYFMAEPQTAKDFLKQVEIWKAEEEALEQQHYEDLKKYVKSLTKEALQKELLSALVELEERRNDYW